MISGLGLQPDERSDQFRPITDVLTNIRFRIDAIPLKCEQIIGFSRVGYRRDHGQKLAAREGSA
jgi:hypothetical protein